MQQPPAAAVQQQLKWPDRQRSGGFSRNQGLRDDFAAAAAQGMVREEAAESGLLYWLGLCQALMISLIESRPSEIDVDKIVRNMTILGLSGLGISYDRAVAIAET